LLVVGRPAPANEGGDPRGDQQIPWVFRGKKDWG